MTVLAGGVGAARFLRGLTRVTDPRRLTVIGNTADDDEFFGLHVSPDLDTVSYTLADLASRERGWGVARDSFACLAALERFYTEHWFRIGDRDLATNLYRTERLRAGSSLAAVTSSISRRLGIRSVILPMTNDRVRTFVHTTRGRRSFQTYLVRDRARERVRRIEIAGARHAHPAPGVLAALRGAGVVIVPPSNPLVSIGPILALPGVRRQLRCGRAPVAAISPLIAGRPVKGPAHRMLRGMGIEASSVGVARLYADFVDLFVIDRLDAALESRIARLGCQVLVADTVIKRSRPAARLAEQVLRRLSNITRPRQRSGSRLRSG